ncbi:glycosyltransferase family 69 protein [Thelephora terrestris]|uniref:Glycosyltransferase family 69 protein n=1 Tax=Thelephora terrestris TaxID=56493 RepID=A0A9P6H7S8_9AGAM|nr:glycosyltransferase family 69 protein [Thelephora terrestris]
MKPKANRSIFRTLPTWLSLTIGVLIGIIVSKLVFSSVGVFSPFYSIRTLTSFTPVDHQHKFTMPTIEQRFRVLELLTTLAPHYTKECTRHANPLYAEQARERYATLIGHNEPLQSSWITNLGLGLGGLDGDQMPSPSMHTPDDHKYFFAINLYNSFDVIPDLFPTLFKVSSILGFQNVYVSIYENGSDDQTKALLRIFDALCRSVGLKVHIRTSMRTRSDFAHRIEYLAEVRNAAFVPLHELRDSHGEHFDTIVFMNDILPCVDDLLELIYQSRLNNAGITCAADYMYHEELGHPVFYDNWVARDINGTALENAPFEVIFHHPSSNERWQRHLPVQVQSCWNGIAILDPMPFYTPPSVKFRMANILENECSASECSLICNDYWQAGFGRIMMVPRVKLAYDNRVFPIIHPSRRNLTAIRGYLRLGGLPDNPRTDPQDRAWFGPHDRLFIEEESEPVEFVPGPDYVWCWGWDGAGVLDGPDVDPIWEKMPNRTASPDAIQVRHRRDLKQY